MRKLKGKDKVWNYLNDHVHIFEMLVVMNTYEERDGLPTFLLSHFSFLDMTLQIGWKETLRVSLLTVMQVKKERERIKKKYVPP